MVMYIEHIRGKKVEIVAEGKKVKLKLKGSKDYLYELNEEFNEYLHLPLITKQAILLMYVNEAILQLKYEFCERYSDYDGKVQVSDVNFEKYELDFSTQDLERLGSEILEELGYSLKVNMRVEVFEGMIVEQSGIRLIIESGEYQRTGTVLNLTGYSKDWGDLEDYICRWVKSEFYKLLYALEDDVKEEVNEGIQSGKLEIKVKE